MNLELTASNGKNYKFEEFGKNGDFIVVKYTNELGDKLIYTIRVTAKNRLVMN